MKKLSRAEQAGIDLADSVVEMCNLFYNERAKRLFFKGLVERIEERMGNDA